MTWLRRVMCSVCSVAILIYVFLCLTDISLTDYLNNFHKGSWLRHSRFIEGRVREILQRNQSACHLYFQYGGYQEHANMTKHFCETVDGQKAVCLDGNIAPPSGVCVIYSFGLSASLSFERAMTSYGCDVYAFDRTVHHIKKPSGYQHLHLFSMGLGAYATKLKFKGKRLGALSSVRKYLKHTHRAIDFVSINLMKNEQYALEQILNDQSNSLESVRQIGIRLRLAEAPPLIDRQIKQLRKLEEMGFVRFFSRGSCLDENVFELSYLNLNFTT